MTNSIKNFIEDDVIASSAYKKGRLDERKELITQLIKELPEEKKKREPAKTLSEIASAGYINGWNACRQEVLNILNTNK